MKIIIRLGKLLIASYAIALTACASVSSAEVNNGYQEVALSEVLRKPGEYDAKKISIVAWITLENENFNLWESRSAMADYDISRCVSLQNYDRYVSNSANLNRKRVRLVGTFQTDATGGHPMVRLNACSKAALAIDESILIQEVK